MTASPLYKTISVFPFNTCILTWLQLSLATWYFSYVDTLEQQTEGEMLGFSTTVMPSGRVYITTSRYLMKTEGAKFHIELYLDILVRDGSLSWNIT